MYLKLCIYQYSFGWNAIPVTVCNTNLLNDSQIKLWTTWLCVLPNNRSSRQYSITVDGSTIPIWSNYKVKRVWGCITCEGGQSPDFGQKIVFWLRSECWWIWRQAEDVAFSAVGIKVNGCWMWKRERM